VAAGLTAALLFLPAGAHADDARSAAPKIEGRHLAGRYLADGDTTKAVTITRLAGDAYRVLGPQWEGVGFFDGKSYWGIFRSERRAGSPESTAVSGTHQGTLRPDGSLGVHGEYTQGRTGSFDSAWSPAQAATPRAAVPVPRVDRPVPPPVPPPDPSSGGERLPKLGDYVYVEELPEAITKVAPSYPEGLHGGVEGTVLVQALVGADGRVKDTVVEKSIPVLDEAAVAAVRQWVFKPAMAGGKPVAVWVAIPVEFSVR
jgi:TonB family protein